MRLTDTSDLWWKTAVVYCVDVKRYADSDGDGWGDFRGLTEQGRLPGRPRGDLPVADAVLPEPVAGRRLRHQRLLHRRPAAGDARRPGRLRAHRARPRAAGDRRPGAQPHLRGTQVVPGGAQGPGVAVPPLVRLERRPAADRAERRGVPRRGDGHLAVRRGGQEPLPAPLLPVPAGPRHQPPGRARRAGADRRVLERAGHRRLPDGRGAGAAAERRRRGEGAAARPARVPARPARLPEPAAGQRVPARRGEPAARPAAAVLRRRRVAGAVQLVRLHHDGEPVAVDGPRRGRPAGARAAEPAGRSRPSRSGRRSSATTTS